MMLDEERLEVSVGTRTFPALTKKEFAIVKVLSERKALPVSRHEIAGIVFKRDWMESNLIDVHIKNIRRKCGKGFVVTHRGDGYLLNPYLK